MIPDFLSARKQAHLFATGLATVLMLGTFAVFLGTVVAAWLAFQLVALLLASIVETSVAISHLYTSADSPVRLFILCLLCLLAYRVARLAWRLVR